MSLFSTKLSATQSAIATGLFAKVWSRADQTTRKGSRYLGQDTYGCVASL